MDETKMVIGDEKEMIALRFIQVMKGFVMCSKAAQQLQLS